MYYLTSAVLSLFAGGSNPTALVIHWHLLNCAANPDTVQLEIQREIDDVIGRERDPSSKDQNRMPFTMAAIWEMQRWRTIAPFGMPREATQDIQIRGFLIPEGTLVIPNIWAVHMDPDTWRDPDIFDPTRFLEGEPRKLVAKPERLLPFSLGKRMCPAERMATLGIFLCLTSLLQKFRVLPEEGQTITMEAKTIFLCTPMHQKLRFLVR